MGVEGRGAQDLLREVTALLSAGTDLVREVTDLVTGPGPGALCSDVRGRGAGTQKWALRDHVTSGRRV